MVIGFTVIGCWIYRVLGLKGLGIQAWGLGFIEFDVGLWIYKLWLRAVVWGQSGLRIYGALWEECFSHEIALETPQHSSFNNTSTTIVGLLVG